MGCMTKTYDHKEIEKKWQILWDMSDIYAWDANVSRDMTFVIDTPPPTVSGSLHMGHVFGYAQTDFIARFQRMCGKNVFFPIGFDDNGLPTERYVEKTRKVRAVQMNHSDFSKLCREVSQQVEAEFRMLFKSIALSVDWSHEYQTISTQSRCLSQLSFLDLYNKGHIHRCSAPVFWDPIDRTAIAQTEIEDRELQSTMSDIAFISETDGHELVISTTRPELIPACTALLYHPADVRYKDLDKTLAISPIFGKKIPIIADDEVEIEKGTGLVMCCTFGDIQDVRWQKRYGLHVTQCVDCTGRIQNANDEMNGLRIPEARIKILATLKGLSMLKSQRTIAHSVKCAERSGSPLELIPTSQWYIMIMDKKHDLIHKARDCQWHPHYMRTRLENWIEGLNQEWCISRQRYSGVPFPVWYSKRRNEEGNVILADISQLPVDPLVDLPIGYTREEVDADTDVMDTWATSAISPQLSSLGIAPGYMLDEKRHHKLFPCDLRPQGHDIIRTWAFCTIVKSMLHENATPWKNVMINGWCMTDDKVKMSKSKGNAVSPTKLVEEKGADVVRYWASTATPGADIVFSEEKFQSGKKLITKLWNAAKFCEIHTAVLSQSVLRTYNTHNYTPQQHTDHHVAPVLQLSHLEHMITHYTDKWIWHKLRVVVTKTTQYFEQFEYYDARATIEHFFWHDFCDNYLELVKARLYENKNDDITYKITNVNDDFNAHTHTNDTAALDVKIHEKNNQKSSAQYTLFCCMNTVLRLFAPFMPHITEEIYHTMYATIVQDDMEDGVQQQYQSYKCVANVEEVILPNMLFSSIHSKNTWPTDLLHDNTLSDAYTLGEVAVKCLELVRKFKSEHSMSLNARITKLIIYTDTTIVDELLYDIQNASCATQVAVLHSSKTTNTKDSEQTTSTSQYSNTASYFEDGVGISIEV